MEAALTSASTTGVATNALVLKITVSLLTAGRSASPCKIHKTILYLSIQHLLFHSLLIILNCHINVRYSIFKVQGFFVVVVVVYKV